MPPWRLPDTTADWAAGEADSAEVANLRAQIKTLQSRLDAAQNGVPSAFDGGPGPAGSKLPGLAVTDLPATSERVDDFAETMSGWFWETDAEHRFAYLSPNVEKITGVPREWHYGKRRQDLGCPASLTKSEWDAHLACIDEQRPFSDFVFRRVGPEKQSWLRTSGKPVFDADGRFRGHRGTAADITAQIDAETRAQQLASAMSHNHDIFETALRTIPDGVQVLDQNLEMITWNDQLFSVLDLDKEQILAVPNPGRAIRIALAERGEFGEGNIDEVVASREAIARARLPVHFERQQASGKWIEGRGKAIHGGGFVMVYRDISDRRALQDKLEQQASTDYLTGIANRRSFLNDAMSEFARARRADRRLSFMLMDIDHFKMVNDSHGHAVGDQALCRVVEVCQKILRKSDRIARFGGEEFVVMLSDTDPDVAAIVADRIRGAIGQEVIVTDTAAVSVTVSVGVAAMTTRHATPEDVIGDADAALYQAKRRGRNRVVCA